MYASVGGELLHYGVKGMKWGVRKERETKGRDGGFGKDSEKSGTFGTVKPVKFEHKPTAYERMRSYDKIHPDLYNAIKIPSWYEYWHTHDANFDEFLDDVRAGSSHKDPNITKAYDVDKALDYIEDIEGRIGEIGGYRNLSEEELNQLVTYGNELSAIMGYFTGTYQQLEDPEKKEYDQTFAKMVDMMPRGSELPKGSQIKMGGHYSKNKDSGPYWVFTNAVGEKKKYTIDQYGKLKSDIKAELGKRYGFNKTSVGKRTREKNVTGLKPVTVQKGKRINVSDKERSEKIAMSQKNQKELVDLTNMLITAIDVHNKRKEKVKKNQNERRR